MAKGSEKASWRWSKNVRECAGCETTLKLQEVHCWHTQDNVTTIWCDECFPAAWARFMAATNTEHRTGMAARQVALGDAD